MEKLIITLAFIAVNTFDAAGYSCRHKSFQSSGKHKNLACKLSHVFQCMTLFTFLLVIPYATTFDSWQRFTLWETTRECWFVFYSFACVRFGVYDLIYNTIQGNDPFYSSDSSVTGKVLLWVESKAGLFTVLALKVFVMFIPFAEAINSL